MTYDVLIKNALCIDPVQNIQQCMDITILGDKIAKIAFQIENKAK